MDPQRRVLIAGSFVCLTLVAWWGYRWASRPPAIEYDNLRYIQLLMTAVSAERRDWTERVVEQIRQRHAGGAMSDQEWKAFQHPVQLAEAGEWRSAIQACHSLAQAQLNRRRALPAGEVHSHQH